jgi:hypothetical protein
VLISLKIETHPVDRNSQKPAWDAVKHKRTEVIVGSASPTLASNRLFSDLMQWVMGRTFKNRDEG